MSTEKTKSGGMLFGEWIAELERLCVELHPRNKGYAADQPEAWTDYFNEDYTPQSALSEDRTYWD